MTNLDLVVELDVVLDHRVVDRAAIDRRVRADFAISADDDTPDLGNLEPAPTLLGHAEAIGTDHRSSVDDAAHADRAAGIDRHPRIEAAVGADLDVLAEGRARTDDRVGPDDRARTDDRERTNRRRRIDARVDVDARGRIDAAGARRLHMEDCRDLRVDRIRVGAHQPGK